MQRRRGQVVADLGQCFARGSTGICDAARALPTGVGKRTSWSV